MSYLFDSVMGGYNIQHALFCALLTLLSSYEEIINNNMFYYYILFLQDVRERERESKNAYKTGI
jgi:hypothetical protein